MAGRLDRAPETLGPADDPAGSLILASIRGHSKNHFSGTKIFLGENRRDFDTNTRARLAPRGSGVRSFADASKCWDWHRAWPKP